MYTILAILIVIASLLLVGVVLIQKSKGGGLAANVSDYNKFAGVSRTTDFVEKATWALAIFICVLSIASSYVAPKYVQAGPQIKKAATEQTTTPIPTAAPAAGEAAGEAAAPAAQAPAQAPAAKTPAAPAK